MHLLTKYRTLVPDCRLKYLFVMSRTLSRNRLTRYLRPGVGVQPRNLGNLSYPGIPSVYLPPRVGQAL